MEGGGDSEDELYNDVPEGDTYCVSCEELRQEVHMLKQEKEQFLSRIRVLQEQAVASEEKQAILVRNISCIFKTAQSEIRRKNNMMNELQTEKENLELQLQVYLKKDGTRSPVRAQLCDALDSNRVVHENRRGGGVTQQQGEGRLGCAEREVSGQNSPKTQAAGLNCSEDEECARETKRPRGESVPLLPPPPLPPPPPFPPQFPAIVEEQGRVETGYMSENLEDNRTIVSNACKDKGEGTMQRTEKEGRFVDRRRECSPEIDGQRHRARSSEPARGEAYGRRDNRRGSGQRAGERRRMRSPDAPTAKRKRWREDEPRRHGRHEEEGFGQENGGGRRSDGDAVPYGRKEQGDEGRCREQPFGSSTGGRREEGRREQHRRDERCQKQESGGRKRQLQSDDDRHLRQAPRRERAESQDGFQAEDRRRKERLHDRRVYGEERHAGEGSRGNKGFSPKASGRKLVEDGGARGGPGGGPKDDLRDWLMSKAPGTSASRGADGYRDGSTELAQTPREGTGMSGDERQDAEEHVGGTEKKTASGGESIPDEVEDGEIPEAEEGEIV